jgi:hypothetical protein
VRRCPRGLAVGAEPGVGERHMLGTASSRFPTRPAFAKTCDLLMCVEAPVTGSLWGTAAPTVICADADPTSAAWNQCDRCRYLALYYVQEGHSLPSMC